MCELASIPPHHVIEDFQEQELNDPIRNIRGDKLDELLFYFRDTYISRFRRNTPRLAPLFAIDIRNR